MTQDDMPAHTHTHPHTTELKLLRNNSYPYNVQSTLIFSIIFWPMLFSCILLYCIILLFLSFVERQIVVETLTAH